MSDFSPPPPLAEMRVRYAPGPLLESELDADPLRQARRWLDEAAAAGLPEPNAMVLATADTTGRPSARHVLLKQIDERGFTFFTNHGSRKGAALSANPRASLCFPWFPMARQLIVEGPVERVGGEVADAYWVSRPRESQLGAWASRQSHPIPDRGSLQAALEQVRQRFADVPVPRPDFWGGYRVVPEELELWQGQPARLHDRLRYRRGPGTGWTLHRLQP